VRETLKQQTWDTFARTAIKAESAQDAAEALEIEVAAVYVSRSRVMSRFRRTVQDVTQRRAAGATARLSFWVVSRRK
jgi:hypothetical protein